MFDRTDQSQDKILFVADKTDNIEPFKLALADLNCEFDFVSTEQQVFSYLAQSNPVAIFLMGAATAFDSLVVAAKIQQLSLPPPILLFIRQSRGDIVDKAYDAGVHEVVQIPFHPKAILAKVQFFIRQNALRRQLADSKVGSLYEASRSELYSFFMQSPVPMVILSGPEHRFVVANEPYNKMVGREVIGHTVRDVFTPSELAEYIPLLDRVYKTGVPFQGKEIPLHLLDKSGHGEERFLDVGYYPSRDNHGRTQGVLVILNDVTEVVRARRSDEKTLKAIENERENFRNIFKQTPEMVCILAGPEHRFEFVNEAHVRALGFDATGLTVREAQPESVEIHGILDEVYRTGKTASLHEIPVTLTDRLRYFNLTYAARFDVNGLVSGVMIVGIEVTGEVELRRKIAESEEHFRNLVDNSPATMWITDEQARCTYLSRTWYEMTGRTPEEDLGFGWVENVHPDDREEARKLFFSAVEAKGRLSIRYRLRQKDGSYRCAVDSGLPRFAKDGTFLGYIGTVVDVQDQIASEGELQDLQTRFTRSSEATQLGVWYCDLPFDVLIWNDQVKEHFFMPPDEIVTIQKFYAHIHPDDRERTEKAISTSIANKAAYDINYRTMNPKKPEQVKWIRAIGWTDYDLNDKPIRFDGITLDVTKEIQRENDLRIAKEEAERANKLKSAFLANMSHEIRTPLGAMLGFAELLRDPNISSTKRANFIDIMTRNGQGLSVIIDDILDLSKVEAGHLSLEYTDIVPGEICEDVVSLLRVKAKQKDLSLEYIVEDSTPSTLIADPTRVRQILLNLVGNAIKFTQFGSVVLRSFGCQTREGKPAVCFEVNDTGIGIPEAQTENVFEMFVQGDGSTTRRFGGTGLGLALSRRLARAMGGNIEITRTSQGHGTTFLVTIEDRPERRTTTNEVRALRPTTGIEINDTVLSGVRVLVIDDAPDNQQLIWSYLSPKGAIIESAENGLVGVRMAQAGHYDIVLMDIQMPEMDGYTATNKLRTSGYQKPIIALTAHAMNEVRDKILKLGANAHMAKPIDADLLISLIAELVRR